jgi:hypothetical protein
VRVTTAFNRALNLPGAWVASVAFTDVGIVVGLRRRGTWLSCPCGWRTRARYDSSRRRWRHLDFACKVFPEADLHRLDCRDCGRVRTELFAVLRAGAVGYLLKDLVPGRFVEAVLAAAGGESVLPPSIAAKLVARLPDDNPLET